MTVDILDHSGRPGAAAGVAARLKAGGIRVGTVAHSSAPAASALEYSADTRAQARRLAEALDPRTGPRYLRAADVRHVTVVLGRADSSALVALLDGFTGLTASGCPSSAPTR